MRTPALQANLRAAWATPIQAAGGHLLGSLGVYRAAEGLPSPAEAEVMGRAAQLAGIAIERALGEEALRSSEAKFRGLFESIAEGVYQSSRDGRLLSVNPAFVAMLGYRSTEEVYALPSAASLCWDPADRLPSPARSMSRADPAGVSHAPPRRSSWWCSRMRAAVRSAGRHIGYEGSIANITERKRAGRRSSPKERAQVTLHRSVTPSSAPAHRVH
jgi:PAS domain S-box-containing protein